MKKLLVIALSAMMLFAFTACNNGGRTVNGLDISVPTNAEASEDAVLGSGAGMHTPTDLMTKVVINDYGVVSGTLNYVDEFTAFNGDAESGEQDGYYFAFKINDDFASDATITTIINGSESKTNQPWDPLTVYRVGGLNDEGKAELTVESCGIRVTTKSGTIYEASFDLSGLTLAEKN